MPIVKTQWGDVPIPDNATDDQIDTAIDAYRASKTPADQEPTGFWGGFGGAAQKQFVDPLASLASQITRQYQQGGQTGGNAFLGSLPGLMLGGMWGASKPHTDAAIEAAKQGNILQMLGQGAAAVPLVGPAMSDFATSMARFSNAPQAQRGATGGEAAFNALNLLSMLPGLPEDALKFAGAGVRGAAPGLYMRSAKFPEAMSVEEMESAARLAVNNKVPLGGFLGAYGGPKEAKVKLGSIIDDNMGPVNRTIQQHGNEQLDMDVALKDVTKEIDKWRRAPDGDRVADDLTERLGKFLRNKSLGIYDHATGKLVGWKPMTLRQAQDLKQGAYDVLPSSIYSDASDAQVAGEKAFNKLIASGIRKAQNEAYPELAEYNNNVHDALNLRNHITDLQKRGISFGWPELAAITTGATTGALGASVGHPLLMSAPAMATTGVLYGLTKPQAASRAAIAMSRTGEGPLSALTANIGRTAQALKSGQQFSDQLFPAPQQPQSKLDLSQVPIGRSVPLEQIPMLIDARAKEEAPGDDNFRRLARAVAEVESGTGRNVLGRVTTSGDRARGVFQLMGDTAKDLGVNRDDTKDNIKGGVKYLKQMLDKYKGNVPTALAAYNWGPRNVDKGGQPPDETMDYIDRVLELAK